MVAKKRVTTKAMAVRKWIALFLGGFVAISNYRTAFLPYSGLSKCGATSTISNKKDTSHQQIDSSDPAASPTPAISNRTTYHNPVVTIVTGFSSNHFMEGINMLQSLIDVQYSGPIYIYLLHRPDEPLSDAMTVNFRQLVKESPLQETIVEMEVEEYGSYCFKPRIIQDFLTLAAETKPTPSIPQVLLWADASIRFLESPAIGAHRMVRDQVDFASRSGGLGMGENTHQKTFDYLNMTKADFVHRHELGAFTFLVNLERTQGMEHILRPYINCGLRECHTCMAPVGSTKLAPNGTIYHGPPSSDYIAHRQDQSVLSLLVFRSADKNTCNISIDDIDYVNSRTRRKHRARTLRFHY
eukprot:scaffold4247_cov66-Cylindrotheca_fusiformis.AAC.10